MERAPRPPLDTGGGLFDEDDDDVSESQEFERALEEANRAIVGGEPARSRQMLEEALRLKPRNQRARNLLGLSLFKLGELDRAEEIYRELIEDHPADPTLRVNLGLVFLKAQASSEAVRCFETALDLSPDHQKAQNYLALSLAQKGELSRARDWFLRCGNAAMAEKMAQQLSASPLRGVAQQAAESLDQDRPFRSALEAEQESAQPEAPAAPNSWVATTPTHPVGPPAAKAARRKSRLVEAEPTLPPGEALPSNFEPPGSAAEPQRSHAQPEPPPPTLWTMAAFADQRGLPLPALPPEGGFAQGHQSVLIPIAGEVLTRADGLLASWGNLTTRAELKRFRGKATDKPFGEGLRRMLRVAGQGQLLVARQGRTFTAFDLNDEPAYFREEVVFTFEESLTFENGRVPSKSGLDLHLVHLRGRGKLLIATDGAPVALEVLRDQPLRIPLEQLVGWHGSQIQPRLLALSEEATELGMVLELSGEGRALLALPPEPRTP